VFRRLFIEDTRLPAACKPDPSATEEYGVEGGGSSIDSPGRTRRRSVLAPVKKHRDEKTGEKELGRRGYAAAPVPAAQPVAGEELATAWSREAKDVFEVGQRSRERARDGGIERSAHSAEKQDAGDARTDLERAVGDVLVRHSIACEVKEQPERHRSEPRADERAAGRARRDVEGDDQAATLACGALSVSSRRACDDREQRRR
jgi:hypothetical protein